MSLPDQALREENPALSVTTQHCLKKAHGICMLIGWFLCIASAILIARYCKKLWPNTKIAGVEVWFQLHRGLNLAGVLLISVAFVCIFVARGHWGGPKPGDDFSKVHQDIGALHSLLGLTAFILAYIQPITSLMRCSPTDSKRPIFNWIHRFLGITAWCIAATTIWLATNFSLGLSTKEIGITGRALVVFYWASLFVTCTVMEVHACATQKWIQELCPNFQSIVMKVRRNSGTQELQLVPADDEESDTSNQDDARQPKLRTIRMATLIFFMMIAFSVTIALVVLIGQSY